MNVTLAQLVRQRIDTAFGGNKAAFARAIGVSPQTTGQLVSGQTTLPTVEVRRRLARELGISHIQIFIMAGELDESEVREAGVEGVVEEGPRAHLHAVIDQYEWEWGEALTMAEMVQALMRHRDESNIRNIPLSSVTEK